MTISTSTIQQLRSELGVGMMDAKNALKESAGDVEKAKDILRAKGLKTAEKKASRSTNQGLIGSYVHSNGKEAGLVAVACETDFVARTKDFQDLCHDIALHIVAMRPTYLSPEEIPAAVLEKEEAIWTEQLVNEGKPKNIVANILKGKRVKYFSEVCLLQQPFVKDDKQSVEDVLKTAIVKLGENIKITGFSILSV